MAFKSSINDFSIIDFQSINSFLISTKIELHILNSLVGSKNILLDAMNLLNKYPEVKKCIPNLVSARLYVINSNNNKKECDIENFKILDESNEYYISLMEKSGLLEMLSNKTITNLYDYIFGIAAGISIHSRVESQS